MKRILAANATALVVAAFVYMDTIFKTFMFSFNQ